MSNQQANPNRDTPLLQRLLKLGAITGLGAALFVWPLAWFMSGQSERLQFIVPADAALIEVNRLDYADEPTGADEDIVALYGTPSGEPADILFAAEADIIRPEENPGLALLKKRADENPLQLATVWFGARMVSLGALATAVVAALLLAILRRRANRRPADHAVLA